MSSKYEFDNTRKAIGADSLSQDERRQMMDKFKGAGGKVLNEKEDRPNLPDEEKSKGRRGGSGSGSGSSIEIKTPSQIAREKRRIESDKRAKVKVEWDQARKKLSGPGARFFIKLRCYFMGLTPFSAPYAKAKFISFLALQLKQALVEFNLIGNEIFLQNPTSAKKIVDTLDKRNPLMMEVLEAAHSLYKHGEFEQITEHSESSVALETIDAPLKDLFRKLYYIYPYQELLKRTIFLAIDLKKQIDDNDDSINRLETIKKKVNKNVKTVFQTSFHRIFNLICRMDNMDYPPFSPLLEKALDISLEDKLGKRKGGESTKLALIESEEKDELEVEPIEEDDEATDAQEEAKDETKEEKVEEKTAEKEIHKTKEYQYGLKLMQMYQLPALRKKADERNQFENLTLNDKVLQSYLFFMEYDIEYSFVQTTNKIKLNPDYSAGMKTDYRQILADLYNESRDIIRAFEKYYEATEELRKLKLNKASSSYIEQSKLETKHEKNIDVEARNTRTSIRSYIDRVTKYLAILIADMKGNKVIVGNMEDAVNFDVSFEGKKRLNGKKVHQCLLESYCYVMALKERLEAGDLFGGILQMSDEEMLSSYGSTFTDSTNNE